MALYKLYSIQVLRGLACVAVVLSHAMAKAKDQILFELPEVFDFNYNIIIFGHFGVDLFFVLSGFIIFLIHGNDFSQPKLIKPFIYSRISRVVPIYWLLTCLSLLLLFYMPELFKHRSELELSWVISSFFFIPSSTSYGVDTPLLGVGWTLNYEIFFYALFALCLFFKKKYVLYFFSMYSLLILCFADYDQKTTTSYKELILSPLIIEFIFGMIAGLIYLNFKTALNKVKWLSLLFALSLLLYSIFNIPHTYIDRVFLWGLGSLFLVLYCSVINMRVDTHIKSIAVKLGDMSYSAYLLQVFTLPFFTKVFSIFKVNMWLDFWSFSFIITILTLLISYSFHKIIEKPLTLYFKGNR